MKTRDELEKELEALRRRVEELERLEEELRESEARYADLYDNSPDMYVSVDAKTTRVIRCNRTLADKLGYTKEEIVGRFIFDLYSPKCLDQVRETFKLFLETGEVHDRELKLRRKDGTPIDVALNVSAVRDEKGRVLYSRSCWIDISARKRAEEALNKERDFGRALVQASPAFFVAIAPDGKTILMNQAMLTALGYKPEEVMEKDYLTTFIPAADRDELGKVFEQIASRKKATINENHVLTRDGRELLVEWHGRPLLNADGEMEYFFGVGIDITKRKQETEALQESEQRFRSLVETTSDCVWEVDQSGKYTYVSPKVKDLLGYESHELIGCTPYTTVPPGEAESTGLRFMDIIASCKSFKGLENICIHKDGHTVVLDTSGVPIFDDEGKLAGYRGIDRDITERKRADEELKQYAKTQEVLVREVNHRVKNNLTAIIGMLRKEEKRAKGEGLDVYLPALQEMTGRVQGLSTVHGMLSAAGWRPLGLSEMCKEVIRAAFQIIPLTKRYVLEVSESEVRVTSQQAHQLTLVINELATNSAKHALGDRDAVVIDVGIRRDGDRVIIEYRDDGPGFPGEVLEEDTSRTRVGFELIHGIVRQSLRGEVRFRNEGGAVATITFEAEP